VEWKIMSRYAFTTKDGVTWTVGFDPALASYFAQRELPGSDELNDITGTTVGQIPTVFDLEETIADQVAIPAEILEQLEVDGVMHPMWGRPDLAQQRINQIEHFITTQITE
jgi:hypothetical protein